VPRNLSSFNVRFKECQICVDTYGGHWNVSHLAGITRIASRAAKSPVSRTSASNARELDSLPKKAAPSRGCRRAGASAPRVRHPSAIRPLQEDVVRGWLLPPDSPRRSS
jgi:hypothetical protein